MRQLYYEVLASERDPLLDAALGPHLRPNAPPSDDEEAIARTVRIRALAQRIEARFKSFFRGAAIDAASPAVSSPGVGDGDDALDDDPDVRPDPTLDLSEQLDAAVAAMAGWVLAAVLVCVCFVVVCCVCWLVWPTTTPMGTRLHFLEHLECGLQPLSRDAPAR
jgi:hypothetical protein